MISYKELGLVNTKEMFEKAVKGGYAIPAYNFNNMEQMQAIIQACVETKSPVILQVSSGARKYANQTLLRYMAQGAVEYAKELGCENPQIVLHLDHGDSFELCKSCIDMGFSSVMIDGSISACASIRSNLAQGNIYKDDFVDVWENRYQPYRDRSWMKTGECADCKYFRYCQGNGMHLRDADGNLILCHLKRLDK